MKIIQHPSPNFNNRGPGKLTDMIVIHYTDMVPVAAALERLCCPGAKVSAHYLITMTGTIYQLVDESKRAWHAGISEWEGETDINSRSIGIELDNPGPSNGMEPFPDIQIQKLIELCTDIQTRLYIPPNRIVGHEHVAPGRKQDPGPLFPWHQLRDAGLHCILAGI